MKTMRWVRMSVAAAAVAVLCLTVHVAMAEEATSDAKIQDLVAKLGDNDYKTREASQKQLIEIGSPAKSAVEKALASEDQEVKQRAEAVYKAILVGEADKASKAIAKNLLWSFPARNGVSATPAIAKGVAYAMGAGDDRRLYAVDLKTGKELWNTDQFGGGANGQTLQVVATDEMVYATDAGKGVYAFSAGTGKAAWKYENGTGVSAPAVVDGKAYIAQGNGGEKLTCFDAKTGKSLWEVKNTVVCSGSPFISDGKIILAGTARPEPQQQPAQGQGQGPAMGVVIGGPMGMQGTTCGLQVLDAKDGHELWNANKGGGENRPVTVADGIVYYVTGTSLKAVKLADGESVWSFDIPQNNVNPNLPFNGRMVIVNGRWVQASDASGVTIADGKALIAGGDALVAVDLKTGKKAWSAEISFKEDGESTDQPANNEMNIRLQLQAQAQVQVQAVAINGRRAMLTPGQTTAAAVADGVGYVGTGNGLVAVELKSGAKLWQLKTTPVSARPVAVDGVLYFGTTAAAAGPAVGPQGLGGPQPPVKDVAEKQNEKDKATEKDKVEGVTTAGLHALKIK